MQPVDDIFMYLNQRDNLELVRAAPPLQHTNSFDSSYQLADLVTLNV